jgi:ATP-dependent DNA ligase
VTLAVKPPVAPMLARLVRQLPTEEGWRYEPKWDGFRCLAFRDGHEVDLRSRNNRLFARYFPEIVEAVRALPSEQVALDGEIVVAGPEGSDFEALLLRTHPSASRVEHLRRETPASFVAFDVLAVGDEDIRGHMFLERRARLEELVRPGSPQVLVTPAIADAELAARWLERFRGPGLDGVVAKHRELRYEAGKRPAGMLKVKQERTADCVVAGFRWLVDRPVVGSLLLGLHDRAGVLRHVGVSSSFRDEDRRRLVDELGPLVVSLEGHPWEGGFQLERSPAGRLKGAAGRWVPGSMVPDWVPLRPDRVCEVAYTQIDAGIRFRHPAQFRRWRPDRDPRSCTFEQLAVSSTPEVGAMLAGEG